MTVKPHVVEELAREVERTYMEEVATPEERAAYGAHLEDTDARRMISYLEDELETYPARGTLSTIRAAGLAQLAMDAKGLRRRWANLSDPTIARLDALDRKIREVFEG